MRFTKMHGCGNDYIYINADTESIPEDKETKERLIRFLSDRHFGIGGDGVILIRRLPKEDGDFEMEMYNADGSRGKMCGNGIRCVGKYVYDHGLTTKTEVVITSCGVPHLLSLHIGADAQVDTATVDMGTPIFTPEQIPLKLPESHLRAERLLLSQGILSCAPFFRMPSSPAPFMWMAKNIFSTRFPWGIRMRLFSWITALTLRSFPWTRSVLLLSPIRISPSG